MFITITFLQLASVNIDILMSSLLVLLRPESSGAVCKSYVELGSTFDNGLSLLGGDVVGDLGAVLSIVHEQHFEISQVLDGELEEPVWKNMSGLLVGTITNVWLWSNTSELSSLSSINTSWMSP